MLSNAQFVHVGTALLLWDDGASYAKTVFFRSLVLTGVGSSFYHWEPSDSSLVVDRLAMSCAFSSMWCHVHGFWEHPVPPILIAMVAVVYWKFTRDLRPYIMLQYGVILSVAATRHWPLVPPYVVAKLCERWDAALYRATGNRISGHTMKHIIAGMVPLLLPVYDA